MRPATTKRPRARSRTSSPRSVSRAWTSRSCKGCPCPRSDRAAEVAAVAAKARTASRGKGSSRRMPAARAWARLRTARDPDLRAAPVERTRAMRAGRGSAVRNRLALWAGLFASAIALAAQSTSATAVRQAVPARGSSLGGVQVIHGPGGQTTVITSSGGHVSASGIPPQLTQVPGAPQAAGDAQAPTARLMQLQQLQFDRRPSAILAAWAELDKAPSPSSEVAESDGPDAEVAMQLEALGYFVGSGVAVQGTPMPAGPPPAAPVGSVAPAPTAAQPQPATQPAAQPQPGAEAQPADPANPDAAAAEAAAAAEEARKKAEEEAKKAAEEAKAIEKEMADLRRNVTLGRWSDVGAYLRGLVKPDAEGGYTRMLQSLSQGPQVNEPDMPPQGRMFMEKNQFSPGD